MDCYFSPKFNPLFKNQYTRYGFYGGRSSGKSYAVAAYAIISAITNSERILTVRKFQNSLRNSSYNTYKEIIDKFGLTGSFRFSDNTIKYSSGKIQSEFLFMGVDRNLNSIKSTNNVSLTIVEEAQDINRESINIVNKTVLRMPQSRIIYVWNPFLATDPVDEYFRGEVVPKHSYVSCVNWQDNPFISKQLKDEIEADKLKNLSMYEHIWEGKYALISDLLIFTNWSTKEISPSELEGATPIIGVDFGYADPNAAVLLYVLGNGVVYIADEIKMPGNSDMFNSVLMDFIPKNHPNIVLMCDCAAPDNIDRLRHLGLNARPAVKGAGSIREGITWLQTKNIFINPKCVEMVKEAENYCWKTDRVGNIISEPRSGYDHLWDAVRYAIEPHRQILRRVNIY